MPELPEVETVRRTLEVHALGRIIERVCVRETRMRYPVDRDEVVRRVTGTTVVRVRRRAKYLLFDLSGRQVMLLHLGMSGRLRLVPGDAPSLTHDHVVFFFDDGRQLRFNDPRRFGMVDAFSSDAEAHHPRLAHLGVEPLSEHFDVGAMKRLAADTKRPIKNFLMDATKVVGVGNIYASEALFLAGIHPKRAAGRIGDKRWARLVECVRHVLSDAIENGGTTLRDFVDAEGVSGAYGGRLRVYGRAGEPCPSAGCGTVRRVVMVGRSTYYCPTCQH